MLIDDYLPSYDVNEHHRIAVRASADRTFAAIGTTDFGTSRLIAVLLAARALPAAVLEGANGIRSLASRAQRSITLDTFEQHGFRILATRPPLEMVIGLEGQFWKPRGNLCTPPAQAFLTKNPPHGMARAAWNFTVTASPDGGTVLATETRVLCADDAVRRRFLPYWYVIRPGSGLIRHAMLRAIRNAAERS